MLDTGIPSLKIEGMALGPSSVGIDLQILLYKDGATSNSRLATKKIGSGHFGGPLLERLPILQAIHRRWQAAVLDKSLSDSSIKGEWSALRVLVAFSERRNEPFTLGNATRVYLAFAAHMGGRSDLKSMTKYGMASNAARPIALALGGDPKLLLWKTKIRKPSRLGNNGAKENLEETGEFIQLMLATIEQLPVSAIRGPLPAKLRYGQVEYLVSCNKKPWMPLESISRNKAYLFRKALERRERASQETSNTKRAMLINLRIEAELLVFINQTGCNLSQALQLKGGKFRYQSDGDYVWIRPWKNRAKHAVDVRIYKGYRAHFEAYMKWRESIFPGDPEGLTFPFVYNDGDLAMRRTSWGFSDTRRLCKSIGKPFVSAQKHRATAGNFVNRRASREVAAELLSNDRKTFQEHYEEPNHQRAAAELVNFWDTMEGMVGEAVGPGGCQEAKPTQLPGSPRASPKPDCEGEGGCLFCAKNRDLRSFDHAWNLASLHHLKLLQFNADRTGMSLKRDHTVLLTVERAAAKLDAMERNDAECSAWVAEARLRVQEGLYHPHYTAKFEAL